jgi:hypothetical protein
MPMEDAAIGQEAATGSNRGAARFPPRSVFYSEPMGEAHSAAVEAL